MRINMPIEPLIGFLIIGLVAGFLAEQIIRGRGAGLAINLVVGVVGAFIAVSYTHLTLPTILRV